MIGGAEPWDAIALVGRCQEAFVRRFLPRQNGRPRPDPLERLFAKRDPVAFAPACGPGMAAACEATGLIPVAIDGKSARGAKRDRATGCRPVVTAGATENRLVLGTGSVPDGSNEVAAIAEWLRTLDLAGALVTSDAAGGQVENARLIRQQDGPSLHAVTDNQPPLGAAVAAVFDRASEADFDGVRSDGHEAVEDGQGRHEERDVTVVSDPPGRPPDGPEVAAVILVNRERESGVERTPTAPSSLTSDAGPAAEFGGGVRGPWGLEKGLPWVLDVVVREDRSRVRPGNAGAKLAMNRRVAVALLRRAPGNGRGTTKRLKAGWDDR